MMEQQEHVEVSTQPIQQVQVGRTFGLGRRPVRQQQPQWSFLFLLIIVNLFISSQFF